MVKTKNQQQLGLKYWFGPCTLACIARRQAVSTKHLLSICALVHKVSVYSPDVSLAVLQDAAWMELYLQCKCFSLLTSTKCFWGLGGDPQKTELEALGAATKGGKQKGHIVHRSRWSWVPPLQLFYAGQHSEPNCTIHASSTSIGCPYKLGACQRGLRILPANSSF